MLKCFASRVSRNLIERYLRVLWGGEKLLLEEGNMEEGLLGLSRLQHVASFEAVEKIKRECVGGLLSVQSQL